MSYKKFTREVGMIAMTNLIMALRAIILLPIITKMLGVEEYGIWAQLVVITSFISPVIVLGLPYSLVRFLSGEKDINEVKDGIYSTVTLIFLFSLAASLLLFIFAAPIANFLQCQTILVQILALILLFECLNQVLLNVLRAFREVKKYSFFIIFQGLGEISLIIFFIWLGLGLLGAVLALLAMRVINFLITGFIIIKKIGVKMPNFNKTRQYLTFGLPTVPENVSNWLVHFNDRFLIGFFFGALFVGYYVPAYTITGIIAFFETPLSFLLPSVLSKLYDEQKIDEVKRYLKYSLKYLLAITIPSFFGLWVLSKQLLTILSTPEITKNGYMLIPFMALGMIFYGLYGVILQGLVLVKKTSILGKTWVGATLLNVILNVTLIPRFGILAAAINMLISYLFVFLVCGYFSLKYLPFEVDVKFILKSVFASMVMSLLIIWIDPKGLAPTFISIAAGVIMYAFLIILLKGFEKKEFLFFKNLLKTKKVSEEVMEY